MKNNYSDRFKSIRKEIQASSILPHARMNDYPNCFTRRRKIPVDDLILSILGKKGLTTSMKVRKYFDEKKVETDISKQAYLNQQKKLNYEVFSYLNRVYLTDYYQNLDASDLFCDYLVLAVDGSKAEIPASDENIKVFGEMNLGVARALVSCVSDVKTQFILDMQAGSIKDSESELAQTTISNARAIIGNIPVIVLFERGYPGLKLINWLEKQNVKYLFRLSSNDYKKERSQMKEADEKVRLAHTYSRTAKIQKKYPAEAEQLKKKKYTDVRIVKDQTPSKEEIAFLTNLQKQNSPVCKYLHCTLKDGI